MINQALNGSPHPPPAVYSNYSEKHHGQHLNPHGSMMDASQIGYLSQHHDMPHDGCCDLCWFCFCPVVTCSGSNGFCNGTFGCFDASKGCCAGDYGEGSCSYDCCGPRIPFSEIQKLNYIQQQPMTHYEQHAPMNPYEQQAPMYAFNTGHPVQPSYTSHLSPHGH